MDIKIEHLDFRYGEHKVFSDFSMELPEGSITCIMGKSGCGKTTLLGLLTGQLSPSSGLISGVKNKRISMVFQENRLCEDFSAKVNVKLACSRGCFPDHSAPAETVILRHLAAVGLKRVADRKISELSGGMKRRVAIVRAILSDSELLLMDEPFKGLDAATKMQTLRYVLRERGTRTLLLVTHDPDEANALGGRLIRL
ncbi:MAG: ATP-binding cassette domain-containing protein [Muribaculaceae bacterium]|nr:ATP-binding cassette domain-containing protein [Roseburia sp.]MCM1429818.1 ATP-binding cassette domain-containing protein [Muribaculaceae bacterium]MCM1492869.1 ATP-binding cassette domain-containing protein [Muribaculaceae bacterium]